MGATILGNNPAGHSFVLRDLVLIELSGHAPPPTSLEEWRVVKNIRKIFVGEGGGRNFNFGGRGGGEGVRLYCWWVIFIKCIC